MCSSMYEAFSGKKVTRCPRIMRGSSTRQIPIPEAVKDCNKHMGGVDLSDALIRYYNVLYKKTKWYNTFFFTITWFYSPPTAGKRTGQDPSHPKGIQRGTSV